MSIEGLESVDVGERLRLAREAAGITQVDAAAEIQVGRTTLLAIEQNKRRVRTAEVQGLARLYNTSVNALLRREAVHINLVPRFRKHFGSSDTASNEAAQLLTALVSAEVELENLLGIQRTRNYPAERPLLPGDARIQAEHDATSLRQWLGLGLAPVRDLITLLELELGIRVYIRKLGSSVSGLFAYDKEVGACMLLNANHPRERRNLTGAHELGHFIATRQTPEILHDKEPGTSRAEQYANAFGHAFLSPARTVIENFSQITAGSSRLTRRHVIILANQFGVSREAMVRRLEELDLARPGTWDWFAGNGGITLQQVQQVLGDLIAADTAQHAASRPTTLRLSLLAAEVSRQLLLSEGQLARLLVLDRVSLREILDEIDGSEANGLLEFPH